MECGKGTVFLIEQYHTNHPKTAILPIQFTIYEK